MSIDMQELKDLVDSKKFITIHGRVFRTDDIDYLTGLKEHGDVTETELIDFIYGYKIDYLLRAIESCNRPYLYLVGVDCRVYVEDLLRLISQNKHFVSKSDIKESSNGLIVVEF